MLQCEGCVNGGVRLVSVAYPLPATGGGGRCVAVFSVLHLLAGGFREHVGSWASRSLASRSVELVLTGPCVFKTAEE